MSKHIEDIGKYHFVLVSSKKIGILTSSNKYQEAYEHTKQYIKEKKKGDHYSVAKLKLTPVSKKALKENENAKIKFVGGPIRIDITFYNIKNGKLHKQQTDERNNKLFITERFLEKSKITSKTVKTIVFGAYNNKLSHKLMVINTIDKLLKIE